MLPNLKNFPVLCRPALSKDAPDVMELVSHIWDGEDYIPYVWQEWLADSEGVLAVAETGGRVVGLGKLTRFAHSDWFMEGLRVHPDWQSRGIANRLNDFLLDFWRRFGSGTIRLATASYNVKVHHMCERNGFRRVVEFVPYTAYSLPEKVTGFIPVTSNDLPSVFGYASNSPTFDLAHNLLDLGWRWAGLNSVHLQKAVDDELLWWWREKQGLLGLWLDEENDELRPQILLALCDINKLNELLLDYRRKAAQLGKLKVGWTAPFVPEVTAALQQAGFERSWDGSLYIFELNKP